MNDADIESHVTYADDVLVNKTRSYVTAARVLANGFKTIAAAVRRLRVEVKLLTDNLTATQTRCTQLMKENRRLRGEADESDNG
jgi:hypothetical protein